MASKQMEHYTAQTLKAQELVKAYNEFGKSIENLKASTARQIKSYKSDMKFNSEEIELINKQLKSAGQPLVEFNPPKKTKST
jgi:arsenate reductase-like glutaredoxin family protein